MEILGWALALGGFALGAVSALVPGFPGCAVALLGLVAFAGLTQFEIVGPWALACAGLLTVVGAFGQVVAPVAAGRAAGGTAGVATGAALGATMGAFVPVPGAAWAGAVLGAVVLGFVWSRGAFTRWLRGVAGTTGGCLYGVALDLVAVLGIAGILGLADFLHAVRG